MVWCDKMEKADRNGVRRTITETAQEDARNDRYGRVWLVYNEPDVSDQCGADPEHDAVYAAHHYSSVYDVIKRADPHARVFAGGFVHLSSDGTRNWWESFLDTLDADGDLHKLEGVHVHLYPQRSAQCTHDNCLPELAQAADNWFTWYSQVRQGLGMPDLPIWISEIGWLPCSGKSQTWVRYQFMEPMSQWFAGDPAWASQYPSVPSNPGYDSVSWYATYDHLGRSCTNLLNTLGTGGSPTTLGTSWNGFQP